MRELSLPPSTEQKSLQETLQRALQSPLTQQSAELDENNIHFCVFVPKEDLSTLAEGTKHQMEVLHGKNKVRTEFAPKGAGEIYCATTPKNSIINNEYAPTQQKTVNWPIPK